MSLAGKEVYNLLFQPGFSTQDQANDLAGRGCRNGCSSQSHP